MICSRLGPTETWEMGTPTDASMRNQIVAGLSGELLQPAGFGNWHAPAGHVFENRLRPLQRMEDGELVRLVVADAVAGADAERLHAGEDVEQSDAERRGALDHCPVARGHGVEPADPPRPAGGGAVFLADLADTVRLFAGNFGHERPVADTCCRLDDPQHLFDRRRRDSSPDGGEPAIGLDEVV